MAIEDMTDREITEGHAGLFRLPPDFPSQKWAAEWVLERKVPSMMTRQVLIGAGKTADGWVVYKGPKGSDKATTVVDSAGRKYFLMVRPREIQNAVNKIYGQVGTRRAQQEYTGETIAGMAVTGTGMLTSTMIDRAGHTENMGELPDQFRVVQPTIDEIIGSNVERTHVPV